MLAAGALRGGGGADGIVGPAAGAGRWWPGASWAGVGTGVGRVGASATGDAAWAVGRCGAWAAGAGWRGGSGRWAGGGSGAVSALKRCSGAAGVTAVGAGWAMVGTGCVEGSTISGARAAGAGLDTAGSGRVGCAASAGFAAAGAASLRSDPVVSGLVTLIAARSAGRTARIGPVAPPCKENMRLLACSRLASIQSYAPLSACSHQAG